MRRPDLVGRLLPPQKFPLNNVVHLFVRITYFSPAVMEQLLVRYLRAVHIEAQLSLDYYWYSSAHAS